MQDKIKRFCDYIGESQYTVFLGGAGVSTESGIPDFRSKDGLYNKKLDGFQDREPEYYLSNDCLKENPKDFFKFIRLMRDTRTYEPNITHKVLAQMESIGILQSVITQNIDRLHQKAGSMNVIEVHGNAKECHCEDCGKYFPDYYVFEAKEEIPTCSCGGYIRPNITLYGENPNEDTFLDAIVEVRKADLLIIGGTSLSVFPVAILPKYFKGKYMVCINDKMGNIAEPPDTLFIKDSLGNVFEQLNTIFF